MGNAENGEAAPARCGVWAATSALALPKMNARTAIRTKNPAQVRTRGVLKATTPTVDAAVAADSAIVAAYATRTDRPDFPFWPLAVRQHHHPMAVSRAW